MSVLMFALLATVSFGLLSAIAPETPIKAQKGGDPVSEVEALIKENDKSSAKKAAKLVQGQKDPMLAQRMGNEFRNLTDADAIESLGKEIEKFGKGDDVFTALWLLSGLAFGTSTEGTKVIEDMIFETNDREVFLKAAALEAMRDAVRTDMSGLLVKLFTPDPEKGFEKKWEDDYALVPITGILTAGFLSTDQTKFEMMQCVVNLLKHVENDRVQFFAAQAASRISGLPAYVNEDFWVNWILQKGNIAGGEEVEPGRTSGGEKAPPEFFGTPAIGKRIVFVIDISGSMAGPVQMPPQDPPKPKKEKRDDITGGDGDGKDGDDDESEEEKRPDYSQVKTKLDLAVTELKFTIENLDDDFLINVVTYNNAHDYLIPSWKSFQKSTDAVKKKFIAALDKLTPTSATNIHGAMMRAFRTTENGEIKGDPALDETAISKGAETIFFLTDGFPCWDDETTSQDPQTAIGNGPFCTPGPIIKDVWRVNIFRKTVIHTVGIGPHDRGLMEALAANSGGTYKDLSGQ